MSSEANRKIKEAIEFLAGTKDINTKFMLGQVKEVSIPNRNCSVEIQLGDKPMTLTEINLSAENNDGFIKVPAIDSTILMCLLSDNSGYVYLTSDIDSVICVIDSSNKYVFDSNGFIWNDGLNGGLIKITNLTSDLNQLVTNINANYALISAAIGLLGGTYSPTIATPFVKSSYENSKIKH